MNSSRITKGIFLLLGILLFASGAAAEILIQKYEHNAFFSIPQEETYVCGCGTNIDEFVLTNHGDLAATFHLQLETEKEWISLSQKRVFVEAGQQVVVPTLVTPPCGTKESTTYKVYATSQYGRFRVAHRTVHTTTCQATGIEIQGDTIVKPCETANNVITITNTANYPETYRIEVPDDVVVSEKEVFLSPGESTQIFTSQQFSCDMYGDKKVPLSVHAVKTGTVHEQNIPLTITWDYDFTLQAQGGSVCSQAQVTEHVTITNTANTRNTFDLSVQGIPFATLEKQVVSLDPQESKTVELRLQPTASTAGTYEGSIKAVAKNGDIEKTAPVTFEVRECFAQNVVIIPETNSVCAGPTDFTVQVQNRGEFTEEYHITVASEVFAVLDNPTVTLRPGEHANLKLTVDAPDIDDSFEITLQVASQSVGVVETVTIPLDTKTHYACTFVEPQNMRNEVFVKDTSVVPILLKNKGTEAATYQIHWMGSTFTSLEQEIFIAPGEERALHVPTQGLENLENGVYPAWLVLDSHRAQYRFDMKFIVKEKSFFDELKEQLAFGPVGKMNWCLLITVLLAIIAIIAIIILVLIMTGAITLKRALWTEKHKQELGVIFGVLFFVCLIAALAASYKPFPASYDDLVGSNPQEGFLEIPQDQVLALNIAQFFEDPDGDELTFAASQSQNLRVRIEHDTAHIKAERDFAGIDRIVFSATDEGGLVTDSPIMTVRVVERQPVSLVSYIAHFCDMLNWSLLAIIFLIALLSILYIEPRPVEHIYDMETGEVVVSDENQVEYEQRPTTYDKVVAQRPQKTLPVSLQEINGVGPAIEKKLRGIGILTIQDVADSNLDELTKVAGLSEWRASKILRNAKDILRNQ